MDFIYEGEANIFKEDLQNFLAFAEELQLKGLTEDLNVKERNKQEPNHTEPKESVLVDGFKSQPKHHAYNSCKGRLCIYPECCG